MKASELGYVGGNLFTYVLSAVQTNEILQIISFCLSILTSLVLLFFRLWSWWKKASADGKIEKEEIDEAIDIIEDHKKGDK